jgi:hypothetical protein
MPPLDRSRSFTPFTPARSAPERAARTVNKERRGEGDTKKK